MPTIIAEVRRLKYSSRTEFQTATAAVTQPISAFITGEAGLVIGFKASGSYRYILARDSDIDTLQYDVGALQTTAAGMSIQHGEAANELSYRTMHFSSLHIPNEFSLEFGTPSDYGGSQFHELLYAEHGIPANEGDGNFFGVRIFIASSRLFSASYPNGLWVRTKHVGSQIQYRIYSSEAYASGGTGTGLMANCNIDENTPGLYHFLDENDGSPWGYAYTLQGVEFEGSAAYYPLSQRSPYGGFGVCNFAVDQSRWREGARVRIPFQFELDMGESSAPELQFWAALHEKGPAYNVFPLIASVEFPLVTERQAVISGELVIDCVTANDPTYNFRSWIELRGPHESVSPLAYGRTPLPQQAEIVFGSSSSHISLGYRASDGGNPIEKFRIYSANAFFEGGPQSLVAIGT